MNTFEIGGVFIVVLITIWAIIFSTIDLYYFIKESKWKYFKAVAKKNTLEVLGFVALVSIIITMFAAIAFILGSAVEFVQWLII